MSAIDDILYHGTATRFDSFDTRKRGGVTGAASAKSATFFTDSREVASAYAVYAAETLPVTQALQRASAAELRNDWDAHDRAIIEAEELDKPANSLARRKQARVVEARVVGDFHEVDAENKTPQELSDEGDIDSWLYTQLRAAKRAGKDGVVFRRLDDAVGLYDRPATHVAVFNTRNIHAVSQSVWKRGKRGGVFKLVNGKKVYRKK